MLLCNRLIWMGIESEIKRRVQNREGGCRRGGLECIFEEML